MRRLASILAALLLVACAGGEGETTTSSLASTTSLPATSPPGTVPPFEEVTVALAANGSHLVDGEGRSLYLFSLDEGRTSTCTGPCAETWPPLLGDPVAADGVDQDLLGNAERGNGAIQVTYNGHPLYTYAGDEEPGDTNGHGFNDVWFLVTPEGEPQDL